jgi:DNA-directed RNA polymerase specialized sigma24 family protein
VLSSRAADHVRHAGAHKGNRRRERPGGDVDALPERGPAWDAARLDLRLDVRAAVADLPADLREVAGLLTAFTPAEVGRRTGLSRQRVRTACRRIAAHLNERGLP